MFTSVFYILTGVLPTIVASLFGFVYIKPGYQVHMLCIEMLVIEIALLILMIIELYKIRKHIIVPSYYKIKPRKGNKIDLMAGVPDADEGVGARMPVGYTVDTTRALLKVIQKINVRDAGKDGTTTKEI